MDAATPLLGGVHREPLDRRRTSRAFLALTAVAAAALLLLLGDSSRLRQQRQSGSGSPSSSLTTSWGEPKPPSTLLLTADASPPPTPELVITVANEYTDRLGPIGVDYEWTGPTTRVIDAFAPARLGIEAPRRGATYSWRISSPSQDEASSSAYATFDGPSVEFRFDAVGDFRVEARERTAGGRGTDGTQRQARLTVASRYVRREVRELSVADRERYLDALFIASTAVEQQQQDESSSPGEAIVDTEEGADDPTVLRPGESLGATLLRVHASNAAVRDADHFHVGDGFLAQHARLDNILTRAIQAVDRRVSPPYWDWTMDAEAWQRGDLRHPYDSELFTATWFGSPNLVDAPFRLEVPGSDDGDWTGATLAEFLDRGFEAWAIRDGRWAYATVAQASSSSSSSSSAQGGGGLDRLDPVNSYGYIRSPWNNNPSPYVTRVNLATPRRTDNIAGFPRCAALYDLVTNPAVGTTTQLVRAMEDDGAHALVHKMLGGLVMNVESDAFRAAFAMLPPGHTCFTPMVSKNAWRAYRAEFTAPCDPASPRAIADCQLDAAAQSDDELAELGAWILDYFACGGDDGDEETTTVGVAAAAVPTVSSSTPPPERKKAFLAALGRAWSDVAIVKGEHFEASGVTDPSFWVVHSTLVRVYQFRLLAGRPGRGLLPLVKDDWDAHTGSYDACISKALACYEDDGATVEPPAECCFGHFANSTYYADATKRVVPASSRTPTNRQVLEAVAPTALPPGADPAGAYVFHHFRWDACDAATLAEAAFEDVGGTTTRQVVRPLGFHDLLYRDRKCFARFGDDGEYTPALQGVDVVAFFLDGMQLGDAPVVGTDTLYSNYRGFRYLFATVAHRDAFEDDPERFVPAWGAFCAWSVSEEYWKTDWPVGAFADPSAWAVVEDRLVFFLEQEARDAFLTAFFDEATAPQSQNGNVLDDLAPDMPTRLAKGDRRWGTIFGARSLVATGYPTCRCDGTDCPL